MAARLLAAKADVSQFDGHGVQAACVCVHVMCCGLGLASVHCAARNGHLETIIAIRQAQRDASGEVRAAAWCCADGALLAAHELRCD